MYAAYPVVLILMLAVIRRSQRGSAARSWLALPATIVGVIFAVGLIMHLLSQNLYPIWMTIATLSVAAAIAPIVSLVAVRVIAGRAASAPASGLSLEASSASYAPPVAERETST